MPVVPPPPVRRDSFLRKHGLLIVAGFCTALGSAAWSQASTWWGGIATRGYVDALVTESDKKVKAELAVARKAIADDTAKAIADGNADVLKEVRIGNVMQLERVGAEIRESVGWRVALHVATDPKRRDAVNRAAVGARAKYDELVGLRGLSPEQARARVFELAGVPR